MREIKFRAIFDGKVVEYIKWQDGNWMYSENNLHWYFEKKHAHSELQQITGKEDKTGREIFEGDIVRTPVGSRVVNWLSVGWPLLYVEDTEIVGNIYENPDLIDAMKTPE